MPGPTLPRPPIPRFGLGGGGGDSERDKERKLREEAVRIVDAVLQDAEPGEVDAAYKERLINGAVEGLKRGQTAEELVEVIGNAAGIVPGAAIARGLERPKAPASPQTGGGQAGNTDPATVLQAVLRTMVTDIPDDPDELFEWQQMMLTTVVPALVQMKELNSGKVRLDDGTVIGQAEFDGMDDASKAQVQAAYAQRNTGAINSFNALMNDLGLKQYEIAVDAQVSDNARRTQDFVNRQSEYAANIDYDKTAISRAASDVQRSLSGLSESRGRADFVTSTQLAAAPWGTGGKTDFAATDMGALFEGFARRAGITDPNATIVKFPGTARIDPAGLLDSIDAALGVNRSLTEIPGLLTQPGTVPQAPMLPPVNVAPPQFRQPLPPTMIPAPQVAPPYIDQGRGLLDLIAMGLAG